MKKLLLASVLAAALGCGRNTPPQGNMPSPAVPAQMIPVQRQVTAYDAQGRPHVMTITEMVPVNGTASIPAAEPIRAIPKPTVVPAAPAAPTMPQPKYPSAGSVAEKQA